MLENEELCFGNKDRKKKKELNNNDLHEDNDEEVPGGIVEEVPKLPEQVQGDTVEEV